MTVIWPRKSATGYEAQLGRFCVSWCSLYGGQWRHWWQPSRWSFMWDRT